MCFSRAIYAEVPFIKMEKLLLDTRWDIIFNYFFQGTLTAIRDWFRDYKIPDGKPANRFALGNQAVNKVLLSFNGQIS
jgi:hypothetical protein